MNILVLISGIADPKWPLPADAGLAALAAHSQKYGVLSPFDEAVLELALKLRDADPQARITGVVAGDEALARKVAGWRLDAVHRVDTQAAPAWNSQACAAALGQALAGLGAPDLVLIGREFGDLDDGSIPPLLGQALGLPHVGLVLGVGARDGALWAARQRGGSMERERLAGPAVLSVTNDASNRLRHPLLKNVMAAKKLPIAVLTATAASGAAADGAAMTLAGTEPVAPPVREVACRMVTGSADEQAAALAAVLLEWGVPA